MMKTKLLLLIISALSFGKISAQKSLRQLILMSDFIAVADSVPQHIDEWETVALSDFQSLKLVPSFRIEEFLLRKKKVLDQKNYYAQENFPNGFYGGLISNPQFPWPPDKKIEKSVVFVKVMDYGNELLYKMDADKSDISDLKNFIKWTIETESLKDPAEKCKKTIEKFKNFLGEENRFHPTHFENILEEKSAFSLYCKKSGRMKELLNSEQLESLRAFVFYNAPFKNLEFTKYLYRYLPNQTMDFYKETFEKIYFRDEDEDRDQYIEFLNFLLEKENKLDENTKLLVYLYYDSRSPNTEKDILNRLKEKFLEK